MLVKKYIKNVLIGVDQLANTIAGGDPDETISSRAGKAVKDNKWWASYLCRFLNYLERDHCMESIEIDEGSNSIVNERRKEKVR